MQTVQKALSLLNHFTEEAPAFGLTEISKASGFDKASTRRLLLALQSAGFVEQDSTTREYTLGAAVLRLAKLRELIRPVRSIVEPILTNLMTQTGETAHFSLYSGGQLGTVATSEPAKSNRVIVTEGESLPIHASASGLAFMAFAHPDIAEALLSKELNPFTEYTLTDVASIKETLKKFRQQGFAVSRNGFEDGVSSVAAPVFTGSEYADGAISVAAPNSRLQKNDITEFRNLVIAAAADIAAKLGADYPNSNADHEDTAA